MGRALAAYGILTLAFVAAMVAIVSEGIKHFGSVPVVASGGSAWDFVAENLRSPLSLLLMQVALVVAVARLAGSLFSRLGQPPVIGAMFAGIALGPSLLGAISPAATSFLFPTHSLTTLGMLSQIGVVLFMFIVGMELDVHMLRQKARTAVLVSHMSIFVPFTMGLGAALATFEAYHGPRTGFLPFALFMGISMSITAFPVLARIIQERGLSGTELGNTAITCAAVGDITAWCSLAFIVAIARAQSMTGAVLTVGLSLAVVLVVFGLIKPGMAWFESKLDNPAQPGIRATFIAVLIALLCALATEASGIHALFGAFVAGVAMPKNEGFRKFVTDRIETFSTMFLLPVFFAFTGLRTQIGLLETAHDWTICGMLLLLAFAGKLGGSALAARISGEPWRESLALGALMNTRGLMELIALNLGLDLGVLSPKIFAMLVIMALVTTFAAGPLVSWLHNPRKDGTMEPSGAV